MVAWGVAYGRLREAVAKYFEEKRILCHTGLVVGERYRAILVLVLNYRSNVFRDESCSRGGSSAEATFIKERLVDLLDLPSASSPGPPTPSCPLRGPQQLQPCEVSRHHREPRPPAHGTQSAPQHQQAPLENTPTRRVPHARAAGGNLTFTTACCSRKIISSRVMKPSGLTSYKSNTTDTDHR